MSDPGHTPPPKGPRPRNQKRHKGGNGQSLATPGNTAASSGQLQDHESGQQSPSGRPRKQQTTSRSNLQNNRTSTPIPAIDGAASPSLLAQPVPIPLPPINRAPNRVTTPAKQVYAGPTFHASPAPSALPMPKFFSKSVPSATPHSILKAQLQSGTEADMPPSPSPDRPSPNPPVPREESPLDIFFNAHRAEKARNSASGSPQILSTQPQSTMTLPQTPQGASRSSTSSLATTQMQHEYQRQSVRRSEKELFMIELDGTGDQEGAREMHTVPFQERLSTQRASSSPSKVPTQSSLDDEQRLAKSLALKRLLKGPFFSEENSMTSVHRASPSQLAEGYDNHSDVMQKPKSAVTYNSTGPQLVSGQPRGLSESRETASPGARATLPDRGSTSELARGATGPSPANTRSAHDVKTMEADLRRLLRLDPPS